MAVRNRFAELQSEITEWRQDIHQHPELMFDTHRTSRKVAELLKEFGCDSVETGIGRTGVVGVIHGQSTQSGKVVGLRADMDALPIHEATGLDYSSRNEGKMHACGHDGHTSMLLGAAKYLAETRNFDGTAVVIFQPAEEGGGGGKEMIEDGMMDRFDIQEVYGMHNMPGMSPGKFAIRPGPFFAAADTFTITVNGIGGHGARPHAAVDPTLAASHIVVSLQSVVSRNVDPLKSAVISVCSFQTDTDANNVIPQSALLRGTIRSFDPEIRELLFRRIEEIADMTAKSFGAKAECIITTGYPVMVNSEAETAFAAAAARRVTGSETNEAVMLMGAEDFSFMLNERPGAYILTGNGDSAPLHHPEYNFCDEAIPAGCSWWVEIAEGRMPAQRQP